MEAPHGIACRPSPPLGMHPNPLYQATVVALEAVLPPRVVSRALKEGLTQVERDAASVELDDIEKILKDTVFRRLQVTTTAAEAKETIKRLLRELRERGDAPPEPPAAEAARGAPVPGESEAHRRLTELSEAIRPLTLYFDWPEVRKLRSQLQVLAQELEAGADVSAALDEAQPQLRLVEQKLEDRLVLQARDLGELEESLEVVQTLGGPRVRRLEALVAQVRQAQAERTLAEGEIERGRKLARDLRKLMESSIVDSDAPPPEAEGLWRRRPAPPGARRPAGEPPPGADVSERGGAEATFASGAAPGAATDDEGALTIDREGLSPEISERLLLIDLGAEAADLSAARAEHAELLRYLPAFEERFTALAEALEERTSIADDLARLRSILAEAAERQRDHLGRELDAVAEDVERLHGDVDASPLERALRVTRGVLSEGLPLFDDIVAIRDLHRGALERSEELLRHDREARSRAEEQVLVQSEALKRLNETLDRPGVAAPLKELRQQLGAARDALADLVDAGRADAAALERAQLLEARWERALAKQTHDTQERSRARLRELEARLSTLPALGSVPARAGGLRDELHRALESDDPSESQREALASLVDQLHADAVAEVARRLDALGKEAGESVGQQVLRELQGAARALSAGRFPDLQHLRTVIDQERTSARARDHARLQRLQLEGTRVGPSGVPAVEQLRTALDRARAELEGGRPATRHLDAAEAAVHEVERQMQGRLVTFTGRLDEALARFATVELLNNDDVAATRRILMHLDSQREAVTRVSPGLQHQLLGSLAEAEALLDGLCEAFEATREVADRLVAGGVLDDVLDFFGERDGDEPA